MAGELYITRKEEEKKVRYHVSHNRHSYLESEYTRANTDENDATDLLTDFLPFYEKALPDVPFYYDPVFFSDIHATTSREVPGEVTIDEPVMNDTGAVYNNPYESSESRELAEAYEDFMKPKDYWGLDTPIANTVNTEQTESIDYASDVNLYPDLIKDGVEDTALQRGVIPSDADFGGGIRSNRTEGVPTRMVPDKLPEDESSSVTLGKSGVRPQTYLKKGKMKKNNSPKVI